MLFGAAGLIALVKKFVDTLKYLSAKNWRQVITQLIAWASGLAGVFLFSATAWASDVKVGAISLRGLNSPSKVVIGLMIASLGSLVTDTVKAVDNTDSASIPPLGG